MSKTSHVGRLACASQKKILEFPVRGQLPKSFPARASLTGKPLSQINRAGSTDNASARPDNQRCVDETSALKDVAGFGYLLRTVNHAGVTARGFRLVKVEPRDSKSSERFPFGQFLKRQKSKWFLFATASNPLGNH
jgi:hypothetical protein